MPLAPLPELSMRPWMRPKSHAALSSPNGELHESHEAHQRAPAAAQLDGPVQRDAD